MTPLPPPIFQVGHLERLPLGTAYPAIVAHVSRLLTKLPGHPELVIDFTGVGRPVFDMFVYSGISPTGVLITGGTAETRDGMTCSVLTRSLADFARLVELFDAEAVSFVSVTQQFNTTSSMGRLTLNVLLSFAQFEREVTGERIRDKIAASKKKGMWMGGNVPLGYDANERTLVINPAEAE